MNPLRKAAIAARKLEIVRGLDERRKRKAELRNAKILPPTKAIRISKLMRRDIRQVAAYNDLNYKKLDLAQRYRGLPPELASDPSIIRWYVRKWRKLL